MARRLRRGSRACSPMGFSPASVPEGFQRASGKPFGAPAGACPLPRAGNDAPTTARVVGLPPYGFLAGFGARRFPKGERKALWCASRRTPLSPGGIDAPTTAREVGLQPRRGIVLSFGAKESTKESMRHGDSEGGPRRYAPWASACGSPFGAVLGLGSLRSPAGKSPLLPLFERGSSQCRAQTS